jgi:hypothetical protein
MIDPLQLINPFHYVSKATYSSFWTMLFNTVLRGIGAKICAVGSLILAYWLFARRDNFMWFIIFYIVSAIFTFGGSIIGRF